MFVNRDIRLIGLSMLLWGIGEGLFFFIQPLYIQSLGASPVEIGSLLGIAGIATTLSFLPAGILADRLERKKSILGGYILGVMAGVLLSLATSWQQLIPGLLLYAFSGYIIPILYRYVAAADDSGKLGQTFSLVFGLYALGVTPSPAIGGWLAGVVGMRGVYIGATFFFLLSTICILLIRPQRERSPAIRQVFGRVMQNRHFLIAVGVLALVFLAVYLPQPLASNFLYDVRQMDIQTIGLLASGHALGSWIWSMLLGRISPNGRRGLVVAQILSLLSVAILIATGWAPALAVSFFARGAFGAMRSLASAWIEMLLRSDGLGLGLGILHSVAGISTVLGPLLAGWLYAQDPFLPLWVAVGAIILSIPAMTIIAWSTQAKPDLALHEV